MEKPHYEKEGKIPEEWIGIRSSPGIWTAMFHPTNTFSISLGPFKMARFHFKDDSFINDRKNPNHQELWEGWKDEGKENPWRELKNSKGDS